MLTIHLPEIHQIVIALIAIVTVAGAYAHDRRALVPAR